MSGRIGNLRFWVVGSLFALTVLILLLVWNPFSGHGPNHEPLLVYCGAGIRSPVEAAAKQFEAEYGIPIRLQLGPSQSLLAQAEISKQGDVFIPGDDSFIAAAREKGLVGKTFPLARMTVVLAVRQGNPKNIRSVDDLLRSDVRLGQAQPDVAAAGRLARDALKKTGRWESIEQHTLVFKGTVNDVANDLKLGTIDAGFLWDVLARQYGGMEIVPIPELRDVEAHVSAGLLMSSKQPMAAEQFAQYLTTPEKGGRAFKDAGFLAAK